MFINFNKPFYTLLAFDTQTFSHVTILFAIKYVKIKQVKIL